MRRLITLLLLCAIPAAAQFISRTATVPMEMSIAIDSSGDSAQVIKVRPTSALDSFTYFDSINDTVVAWTSPLQKMQLTPGLDTSITYGCTVAFAGGDLGFAYDATGDSTLANIIAALVDSFNNVTGLSDSVSADDSTTYILLTSLFSTETYTARWTMKLGDSLDTASEVTDIEMVCDSMASYINADTNDAVEKVTAASEDTVYTLTADDHGLAYTLVIGDTAQDTSLVRANYANGVTDQTDTFNLFSMADPYVFNYIYGNIIIDSSLGVSGGYQGAGDTIITNLYATYNGVWTLLSGPDTFTAYPCTVTYVKSAAAGNDTLFKDDWKFVVRLKDTATSPGASPLHAITVNFLRGQTGF